VKNYKFEDVDNSGRPVLVVYKDINSEREVILLDRDHQPMDIDLEIINPSVSENLPIAYQVHIGLLKDHLLSSILYSHPCSLKPFWKLFLR